MSHVMVPPRFSRIYHTQVKTHKLTIMHSGLGPGTSIAEIKSETLSALKADVASDALDINAMEPPQIDVETEADFELCRAVKEKGKFTGNYEVLEPSKVLRESGLAGWETIYLQFKDRATGELMPITYTLPSMYDEEDEQPQTRPSNTTASDASKGKRKADDIDEN